MILYVIQDLTEKLLPLVLPAVLLGLQDQADDVRAVAAAALLPVSESLPKFVPNEVIEKTLFLLYFNHIHLCVDARVCHNNSEASVSALTGVLN